MNALRVPERSQIVLISMPRKKSAAGSSISSSLANELVWAVIGGVAERKKADARRAVDQPRLAPLVSWLSIA